MELRVARKFRVGPKIGSGSFGEIYAGTNVRTGEEVAIKLEPLKSRHPQLRYESQVYRALQGGYGIPAFKYFGSEGDYNVMVIEMLGPSLDNLFRFCDKRFTLKTVLMLADQMLHRLEFLHSRTFIHKDLKPDNFLIGTGSNKNICYLIDFGSTKNYQDPRTGQHVPLCEDQIYSRHCAVFGSMNSDLGYDESRRDDIESLGYVLMYFLRGSLPWQEIKTATKSELRQKMFEIKHVTHHDNLCKGFPAEFSVYFDYCRSLGYEDCPDYMYLRSIFAALFKREHYEENAEFDWNKLTIGIETIYPPIPLTVEAQGGCDKDRIENSAAMDATGGGPDNCSSHTPVNSSTMQLGGDEYDGTQSGHDTRGFNNQAQVDFKEALHCDSASLFANVPTGAGDEIGHGLTTIQAAGVLNMKVVGGSLTDSGVRNKCIHEESGNQNPKKKKI